MVMCENRIILGQLGSAVLILLNFKQSSPRSNFSKASKVRALD